MMSKNNNISRYVWFVLIVILVPCLIQILREQKILSKYLFSSTTSSARHDDDSLASAANNNYQDGELASVAEDFSPPTNTTFLYDISPAVAETSNNQNREVSSSSSSPPPRPLSSSSSSSSADKDVSSPPPIPDLIHGVEKSFLNQVAYGRNFTNPQQVYKTLIQILERDEQDQFNATRDIIVFEHYLKTGGTSLSLVLEKMAGGPEGEGIMPGSHGSDWFKFNLYPEHIQQLQQQQQQQQQHLAVNTSSSSNNNTKKVVEDWWQNLKTVYSHTKINRINVQESTLEKFLKSNIPSTVDKRFRLVTMIRDPLPYLASNMNEWACSGDLRLRLAIPTLDEQAKLAAVKDEDPCYNISWTESYDIFIENYVNPYCNNNITEQKRQQQLRGNEWTNKVNCTKVNRGEQHMADCQSIPIFMTSQRYNGSLHNDMKHYVPEAYNKYAKGNNNNVPNNAEAISQIEIQALERLGGLSAQSSIYMMWHGITERMVESMCLFHSIVQFPYYETPHRRNKECRPTSYFTQNDKAKLRDFEILDYTVSRAAHAILDIRMAKLCRQLLLHTTKNNNNNETNPVHESLPVDACCSNFAFDSEGRIQNHTLSIVH